MLNIIRRQKYEMTPVILALALLLFVGWLKQMTRPGTTLLQGTVADFDEFRPKIMMHFAFCKGQLISKCPYEKSVLSKIPTKKFPRFLPYTMFQML